MNAIFIHKKFVYESFSNLYLFVFVLWHHKVTVDNSSVGQKLGWLGVCSATSPQKKLKLPS